MANVRNAIRDLGSNGNLSRKEVLKITKENDVSQDRVIRQLDKVNSKSNSAPIGLGAAAANSYLRQPRTMGGGGGDGPIASGLRQMMPTNTPMRQGQGGYSTPGMTVPKGQQVFGSFNGAPQLQIKPSLVGSYGGDSKYSPYSGIDFTINPNGPGPWKNPQQAQDPAVTPADTIPATPIPPEVPTQDPVGMMSGGGAGINGTAGIRRKKSSWGSQGKSTKGTSNLNRNLTVSGYNMK